MRSLLVAFALVLVVPRTARAQSNAAESGFRASLEYVAPADCPSASDFQAIVVGRLGFDPFRPNAAHHVLVAISPGAQALEGRLEWREADGKWAGDQAFPAHTRDCADLARTMGFALAVQINLLATGAPPPPADEATAETEPAAPKQPPARRAVSAASSQEPGSSSEQGTSDETERGRAHWALGLGAGGSLALGLSPGSLALGRVFGSLARGRASLELGAELSSVATGSRDDGAGFAERVLLASAAACGTPSWWTACVLAKGGASKVSGERVDVPASSSGVAAQLGLRAGLRQLAGSVFFVERVEGLVNLTRSTVTIDRIPVWTAPLFAATFGLDVGFVVH